MSYLIVNVSHRGEDLDSVPGRPDLRCVDGRLLRPGTYASQVQQITAPDTVDGRQVTIGYHAVLWPMDRHAPLYEQRPQLFGPFVSRARAEAFILEVSTEVEPFEGARPGVLPPGSYTDPGGITAWW